jgi:hypothetical protein
MFIFLGLRWRWLWATLTIALSALILVNNGIYLRGGPQPLFFVEKGSIAQMPVWRAAFYLHIVGASVCLATGIPLMFTRLLRYRRTHHVLGYLYLNSVLWAAAPAGVVMAPFAKGGALGALAFGLMGILWWWTTWSGYVAIRRNDLAGHLRGMVRSYALALSAVTFRLFQAALFHLGMDDHTNYIVSLWLSFGASVWLGETCLYHQSLSKSSRTMTATLEGAIS